MDFEQLMQAGGFVSTELVKKEVTWSRPTDEGNDDLVFTVHIKRQSFGALERIATMAEDQSKAAKVISECVRLGDEGKQVLTYQNAFDLHPGLATALLGAINEVNSASKN